MIHLLMIHLLMIHLLMIHSIVTTILSYYYFFVQAEC